MSIMAGEKEPPPSTLDRFETIQFGLNVPVLKLSVNVVQEPRAQSTPAAAASLVTVGVKDCVPFTGTVAVPGETDTMMASEKTVMVELADLVLSVVLVALMVTVAGLGTTDGAV